LLATTLEFPNTGIGDMSELEAEFSSPESRLESRVQSIDNLVDRNALSLAFERAITDAQTGLHGQSFENGLDPLGNARKYHQLLSSFGENDSRVAAQYEILEADMATLLMEEITSTNYFSKQYRVEDGTITAAGQNLSEVYARCLASADADTPAWMLERFAAELEEILSFEQLIASGEADRTTHVTISPTPFQVPEAELEKYSMRGLLMIRFMEYDPQAETLNLSQIQLPQDNITEGDLRTLFDELGVKLSGGHLDTATSMLEAGILVDSNYLSDQTDIVRILDEIIARRAKKLFRRHYAFMGSFVTRAVRKGSDYQEIYAKSAARYELQKEVIAAMVNDVLALSLSPSPDFDAFANKAKADALAKMSRTEIENRYGKKIAEAYAIGGFEGAKSAGMKDGLSGSCPSSGSSSENKSGENDLFCARLPKPGETACCPGCKQMVVVTGTEDNIKCSNGACSLADAHSRALYLASLSLSTDTEPNSAGKEVWHNQGLRALFFIKKFVSLEELAELEAQQQEFALTAYSLKPTL
jgi:hypothetical protein